MAVEKSVIQTAARQALDELGYSGWVVSAVWQQKSLPPPWQQGAAKVSALKTWCVDYTNDQGSFPRVYFRCEPGATAEWIKEEIKGQLTGLKKRLAFMDAAHTSEAPPPPATATAATPLPSGRDAEPQVFPPVVDAPSPSLPSPTAAVPFSPPVTHQTEWRDQSTLDSAAPQHVAVPAPPVPAPLPRQIAPVDEGAADFLRVITAGDEVAVRRLVGGGADVNVRMSNGMTPLIHAAFFDRPEIVAALLCGGADRGARDQLGMTALDWAKSKDNADVVRLLEADAFHPPVLARAAAVPTGAPPPNGSTPTIASNGGHAPGGPAGTYSAATAGTAHPPAPPRRPLQTEAAAAGSFGGIPAAAPFGETAPQQQLLVAQTAPPLRSIYLRAALLVGALLCLVGYLASLYRSGSPAVSSQSSSATTADAVTATVPAATNTSPQPPSSATALSTTATKEAEDRGADTGVEDSSAAATTATGRGPAGAETPRNASAAKSGKEAAVGNKKEAVAKSSRPSRREEGATLRSAVAGWVAAGDNGDIKKQMTYYAPRVTTYYEARNVTRPEVESEKTRNDERRQRRRTDESEISLGGDGNDAVVRLPRRSADGRAEVVQELRWQKTRAGWKIVAEREVPSAP